MGRFFSVRTVLVLGALTGLLACAPMPVAQDKRSDWVTESDETPARKRARLRLELATAYYQQGQDAAALDEVKQALAHDQSDAAAWNLRGLIYLRQRQWERAQHSFEQALTRAPQDPDVAHNYAWMLCQQNPVRLQQAEPLLRRALAQPAYAQAAKSWAALGQCQQRAGQLPQAELSLRQALALAPTDARALWPMSQVLYAQGRWQQAADALGALHAQGAVSAESLWLGVRVAHRLDNRPMFAAWAQQLRQDFGRSPQAQALDKGLLDE